MKVRKKRPDTSKRKKERATKEEYVIKSGLQNHLKEKKLSNIANDWVINLSKITNRGSLIFNRLLLYCMETNDQLPDLNSRTTFIHCFTVGLKNFKKEDLLVKRIFKDSFSDFPLPENIQGDTQAITYAATTYMTNFHTYLEQTFYQKQKKLIKEFCNRNKLDKEYIWIIKNKINNWKITKDIELSDIVLKFIENQKRILQIKTDDKIDTRWLKAHTEDLVYFNYETLKQFEEWNLKLFTLAPISSIRNHFMTIDTMILYNLMKNADLIDFKYETFYKYKDKYWNKVFKIGDPNCKFNHFVETDGVSICIHYLRDRREKKGKNKKKDKEKKMRQYAEYQRIIAIDPGRTNMIFGIDKDTGETYKLTRKQYYHETGISKANKESQNWNKEMESILEKLSQLSIKTTKVENWTKFLKYYTSKYRTLWGHFTQPKWARQRFGLYIRKNQCLDKFFASMRGREDPIIAYGEAKINPNNKNELSVPTTFLGKKCAKYYKVKMVNEYNTTKKCCDCHEVLEKVKKDINGKVHEIRGLRWCSSTGCRKFVNRDLNAAKNILVRFLSGNHVPDYLSENPRSSKSGECRSDKPSVA